MNKILINSRCFLWNFKDPNDQILKALSYKTDGVQISFLDYKELLEFDPNDEVKKRLKNTYNIFHAPTNHIYYNNPLSIKILKKIKKLYKYLNCDCIIFHHNSLFDPEFIIQYLNGCNLSVENLDVRIKENNNIKYLKNFLRKYNSFKLTLDFCHAMSHSKNMLKNLINELKNKVVNIHWSLNKTLWLRHHSPSKLKKEKKEDVDFMIKMLKKLDSPVVLEIRRNYVEKDSNLIDLEIEFLKSKLFPA